MSAAPRLLKRFVRLAGRALSAGLCAALALALVAASLAVLAQALAVLAVALLALALLLPHPVSWYAEQGGAAFGVFFHELLDAFGNGAHASSRGQEQRKAPGSGSAEYAENAGDGRKHGGAESSFPGAALRQEENASSTQTPPVSDRPENGASGSADEGTSAMRD